MESWNKDSIYLDLENPRDVAKLNDPMLFFEQFANHTVIIDEVQRQPELFPILRSAIDSNRIPGRFILLGSASPSLLHQSAESLAGRIHYLELAPFTITELQLIRSLDGSVGTHQDQGFLEVPLLLQKCVQRLRTKLHRR